MFQTTNQAIIVFLSISIRFVDLFCAGRTPTLEAPTKNSFSLRLTMRCANCSAWDPYSPPHGGRITIAMITWLVVEPYPSGKYDFVSWDDDIPN